MSRIADAQISGPQSAGESQPAAGSAAIPSSEPCYLSGSTSLSEANSPAAIQQNQGQEDQFGEQLSADQSEPEQALGTESMSAEQIIAFLQQSPELLATSKSIAGQSYGVDPLTLSDAQIDNCIRLDLGFREKVSNELQALGYASNPPDRITGTSEPQRAPQQGAFAKNYAMQSEQRLTPRSLRPNQRAQSQPADPSGTFRVQRTIPYPNLPSLRDLYSQFVGAEGKPRRFGSDVFQFGIGTGNASELPMDLPVGPDYVLGPGDNLIINMWGGQSNRLSRIIDRQGQIALPDAGTVTITGLTVAEAQSAILRSLGTQYKHEQVEISLGRVRTVRVYVVGDVQRPGAYDLSSLSTPFNALYAAGGPTSRGSLRVLKQYRGKELLREIDLYDFLLRGVRSELDRLSPGDTILVPPAGPQVTVTGMVRRPAIYELKGEQDLKEVLDLAGGVLVSASLQQINVDRIEAHQSHTMFSVSLPDGAKGDVSGLPPFPIKDGDNLTVLPILPFNEQVVYLDGHVFKPGPYAWHDGMTVNDLLRSYQDVMPEPADRAEVIRLRPPDLHPETIDFSLSDLLVGNDPVTLQPFDTIRVFSRYEADPPKVSIFGEVLRPGSYPMSEGMTVAGLVRMAGGLRRSAYRNEADLSSYTVQDGRNVLLQHSVVSLAKALDGDKNEDVALHPGDVVGIRQLSGWKDIGASVSLSGEVTFAGTYGIQQGERLSSVLKRAGGFRENAYPAGAVLERVQVRQMEETDRKEMIRRIESTIPSASQSVTGTTQDQWTQIQGMQQQQQQVLTALRNHLSSGRLVIKISADISKWENTPTDIEVRDGDKLTVPKRPDFVLVAGQVYNTTGITFHQGKDAAWYLRAAGGATRSGDKRATFIVRADGSIEGPTSVLLGPGVFSARMHPGDSIVVPEKVIGGSLLWRNLIGTAQIMSSLAVTGAVAGVF